MCFPFLCPAVPACVIPPGRFDFSPRHAQGSRSPHSLDRQKEVNLWGTGFFEMVELLTAPPDRREAILDERAGGAHWRPGGAL